MNILVDTSVWSLCLRRKISSKVAEAIKLQELLAAGENIIMPGIILQEILQGIKDNTQFSKLKTYFEAFPLILPSRETYIFAAALSNKCRRIGIQIATIDCLIASIAIENDCYMLAADQDFKLIAKHSSLKLI